jgi:hypothetical protein
VLAVVVPNKIDGLYVIVKGYLYFASVNVGKVILSTHTLTPELIVPE